MGYDLEAVSGARLRVGNGTWALVLGLAKAYSWRPQGSKPPSGTSSAAWEGRYDSNDGQRVSHEDASALGAALRRALKDPKMHVTTRRIARDLAKQVTDEFERITGDRLPVGELEEDFTCDTDFLETLIQFCSQGSFAIH